jgi:hypothetical protein
VGLTTLPCKKKIVEKPPRNSAGFCGGGQGLSWAVEPRKEVRTAKQQIFINGKAPNITFCFSVQLQAEGREEINY